MTMTSKMFEAASLVGNMCEVAVQRVLADMAREEDTERLVTMSKRQLHKELARQERELVKIANWGPSIPAQQHDEMIARRKLIKFLIHPSSIQGDVSLRA